MSNKYIHGTVVTDYAIASNNRGEGDGSNLVPLQTVNFNEEEWTTVSAEAIRFGLRRYIAEVLERPVRRAFDSVACVTIEKDASANEEAFWDDDLFGYMTTKAPSGDKKGGNRIRKSALDVERAISLTPYTGDVVFNATSDDKNGEKGKTSLYSAEVHTTAYRYGFSLNPRHLTHPELVEDALMAINGIGRVGGNHSRNLFDFSPVAIVLRVSREPSPRILRTIKADGDAGYDFSELVRVAESGSFPAEELHVSVTDKATESVLSNLGVHTYPSPTKAIQGALSASQE